MALFITQCPYCKTSFRTSITQLQSADGMVRCGACLKIFTADDNLIPSAELQTVAMPIQDEDPEQIFTLDLADSIPNRHDPMPTMRATNIDDDFLGEVLHDVARHHPRENFSAQNLAAVHDVITPLEIDWQPRERSGWSTFLMSLLILLLAVGLPAQYVWYHRDELSQNTLLRPWLDLTCEVVSCTLPPLIDIRAISSEDLLVRSHTEIANALSVNLAFRNTAAFAQPFPVLELRFTDADNTLVAQRRFLPAEYLTADLADMQMMPPDAPVQIQLEILDPGVRAVNYEVSFSPVFSQN